MPTTGTKLYTYAAGAWTPVYAELFEEGQRREILAAFDAALIATGFVPEQVWGERIEDRGSQITFSALGQQAPIHAKEVWDPDFAKRRIIQADLRQRLPGLSINMAARLRSTSRAKASTRVMASRSSATRAAYRSTR